MSRLFVGLELPESIKLRLLPVQCGVAGARWQTAGQLHLTLRFIGSADEALAQAIRTALTGLPIAAFEIALSGVGCFGKPERPRVLWTGVVPEAPLVALHRLVTERLASIGLTPEDRPYRPHVTLARFKAGGEGSEDFLAAQAGLVLPGFPVEHVSLFTSVAGKGGSRYQVIGRFPLTG